MKPSFRFIHTREVGQNIGAVAFWASLIVIIGLAIGYVTWANVTCGNALEHKSLPNASIAPYEIRLKEQSNPYYTDNYELGNSVILNGYWTYHCSNCWCNCSWEYKNEILVAESEVTRIKRR